MEYTYDPEGNPIEQPILYEERLEIASKFIEDAEVVMPVLVDEMDNPLWCTYGRMPNMAYLVGMDGGIVLRQEWNDPGEMEDAILDYLEGGA
jgi:hypothetical protein